MTPPPDTAALRKLHEASSKTPIAVFDSAMEWLHSSQAGPQMHADHAYCMALLAAAAALLDAVDRLAKVEGAICRSGAFIDQTLGKALGYPWYKDDPKNFPGATADDGVCTGDHVPESLAAEAASRIAKLEALLREVQQSPLVAVELHDRIDAALSKDTP